MSRIGGLSGVSSSQLSALNRIQELTVAIAQNQQRLTSLKRINSAKDDPSGLVQASVLRSEIAALESASSSTTRASAMLSTADAAAGEIVAALQEARTLALEVAGGTLTSSEVAGNQVEIDQILQSVNSLAGTEFGGRRLLDGSAGYRTSGVDSTEITSVDVLDKNTGSDVSVSIEVTQQAAQATDTFTGTIATDTTLIVTGSRGTTTVSLTSGATDSDIVDAFNAVSHLTGVTAAIDGSDVDFTSVDYGSAAVIQIEATTGTFATTGSNSVAGTDAIATINGQQVTADGTKLNYNSSSLSLRLDLDPTANGTLTPFTVTGEGLKFVTGPSPGNVDRIGLPGLNTGRLGGVLGNLASIASGGSNALTGANAANAVHIIDDAISDATRAQAVIGGFQRYAIDSANRVIASGIENTTAALSAIEDADIALETALLSNNQLMQQTAFQALSITSLQQGEVLNLLKSVAARF